MNIIGDIIFMLCVASATGIAVIYLGFKAAVFFLKTAPLFVVGLIVGIPIFIIMMIISVFQHIAQLFS